jgi:hypothetical protein
MCGWDQEEEVDPDVWSLEMVFRKEGKWISQSAISSKKTRTERGIQGQIAPPLWQAGRKEIQRTWRTVCGVMHNQSESEKQHYAAMMMEQEVLQYRNDVRKGPVDCLESSVKAERTDTNLNLFGGTIIDHAGVQWRASVSLIMRT